MKFDHAGKCLASVLLCFYAVALSAQANAMDISLSGFGSIVAGSVVSGDGFVANFPELGVYGSNSKKYGPTENGWMNQESRFGIQATAAISDDTRATAQVVARGTNQYSPNVTWLFVTHDFTNNLNVQAGQLRLPVYLYSDKMDAGFAYPWLRVPSDAYSLESVNFQGVKVNYDYTDGEFSERLAFYSGTNQDVTPSKLMSFVFDTPIYRKHRFNGVVADTGYGPFQFRASFTSDNMDQMTTDPANTFRNAHFDEQFVDYALQYQIGDLTLLGEWNWDKPFYHSQFSSAIYQMGANAVYLMQSTFILDQPWEKHNQQSIGVRHDIGSNQDIKFDVTKFNDQGMNPFTNTPNPVIGILPGDSTTVSLSYDFIF